MAPGVRRLDVFLDRRRRERRAPSSGEGTESREGHSSDEDDGSVVAVESSRGTARRRCCCFLAQSSGLLPHARRPLPLGRRDFLQISTRSDAEEEEGAPSSLSLSCRRDDRRGGSLALMVGRVTDEVVVGIIIVSLSWVLVLVFGF
jgi:hypothetical protein